MTQYKVEIAFDSGYSTPAASRTWTDVSAYVEGSLPLSITRGRSDEFGQIGPSTLSLTLNNTDGRFTPEKTSGAYYPNVKKGRPLRVTATYNAVNYTRFVGYVDEWPVAWPDSTSGVSLATITATSRTTRMARDAELRSIVEEEYLLDSPSAYFTMGDPATATTASDSSGKQARPLRQAGSGTAVTFGSATGPGTDGLTAATFAGGKYLTAVLASPAVRVELAFSRAGNPAVGERILESDLVSIDIQADGTLFIDGFNPPNVVTDGGVHHVAVQRSGASLLVYIDGASVGSTSASAAATTVYVGGSPSAANTLNGVIAHLAFRDLGILSPARIADHATAIFTGFAGESTGARITRYAAYAGLPAAEVAADTGVATIGHVLTTGTMSTELIQKVCDTDGGIAFDGKDGTFTYRDRDHRYSVASAFTLNATTQEVEADLDPKLDDQFIVNDMTVTGVGGVSSRATDATSISDYGYYRQSRESLSSSDDEVTAAASWAVGIGKQPKVRYSQVSVDVTNSSTAQAALVLAADISTRFGLSNLPSQAPASTADLFVEGYTETLTATSHDITFNTSPTDFYAGANGVWQLDVNNIDGPYVLAY